MNRKGNNEKGKKEMTAEERNKLVRCHAGSTIRILGPNNLNIDTFIDCIYYSDNYVSLEVRKFYVEEFINNLSPDGILFMYNYKVPYKINSSYGPLSNNKDYSPGVARKHRDDTYLFDGFYYSDYYDRQGSCCIDFKIIEGKEENEE